MSDLRVKCSGCGLEFGMPRNEQSKVCTNCGRHVTQLDAMVNPHLIELIMIAIREDLTRIPEILTDSVHRALQLEQPEIVRGFLDLIPTLLSPQCSPERRRVVGEECQRLRSGLRPLQ